MRCFVHTIFLNILPAVIANNHLPVKLQKPIAFENWHRRCSHRNQHPRACFNSLDIRGGAELNDVISGAYDWSCSLGAPAALVAGAVIATVYEKSSSGSLKTKESDTKFVRLGKRLEQILLLSAFGFEVVSIFVTTITGTMLMSYGDRIASPFVNVDAAPNLANSPLGFLKENFEFEYLTSRITFLQGLLNWLGAIAIEFIIPDPRESVASRKMDKFGGFLLINIILIMLSFYNGHMNYYPNYFMMLSRWISVAWTRYVWRWPLRPMMILLGPSMIYTTFLGYEAFTAKSDDDDD
eukprot:CAMPEP_0194353492 /NCGR_PEP_ID=MMETSP0174-20130528/1807_1 /TAXON_ID=216777 /ORGANISM="Proboscia alata, Strain PI-D3" /LENGTH=294 /DNA_ID=CAMNT_0039122063 /DNA_START=47 /DNA_END=931 /DNA_ORIENTATION=+